MSSKIHLSRRGFITAASAAAAFTIVPRHVLGAGQTPPSEKLNIAGIGVGGMGFVDLQNAVQRGHNVIAICDVDQRNLARDSQAFPKAKRHIDFRQMLDTQKGIDGVMIATPDHLHAFATMAALKAGKHVYCEKPLTHSVAEARAIANAAKEAKVATQMGNQGQASEEARFVWEMILDGAIGTVREVHAWSNRKPDISPRGIARPKDTPPVPSTLDWDRWLGPAQPRPYHPCYLPFAWRGWWDFGTGVLGDIGCHQLSTAFKALKLGHPTSVEACSTNWQLSDEISKETAPLASIVRYNFPAEGTRPPVQIIWYDGGMKPPRPEQLEPDRRFGEDDGIMYVGDKGIIYGHRLIPEKRAQDYGKPPRVLPRSPGHYEEWFDACKGGQPAGANFVDHAAHLAEVVLLGNIAIRTNQKILWDGPNMRITNSAEANAYVNPPYREGWKL
ncbi:MAG: Gfo/Idh/MocA family protein [Bacillota bacterium]